MYILFSALYSTPNNIINLQKHIQVGNREYIKIQKYALGNNFRHSYFELFESLISQVINMFNALSTGVEPLDC